MTSYLNIVCEVCTAFSWSIGKLVHIYGTLFPDLISYIFYRVL